MPAMNGEGPSADELLRALAALKLSQGRWLADLGEACAGDPAFTACFRLWQEDLTMVKLQLHRVEGRLLHYLPAAKEREPREPHAGEVDGRAAAAAWRSRLEGWFSRIHLPSSYRRLDSALELDQDAVTSDIITDLAALGECAEVTMPALAWVQSTRDLDRLESTAFFRVVAPWKRLGLPALHEVLRWLSETLLEQEDW
jgi:hypothetical protein